MVASGSVAAEAADKLTVRACDAGGRLVALTLGPVEIVRAAALSPGNTS